MYKQKLSKANQNPLFLKIFSNELLKGSFVIFLGTVIASVLSFLINLFLARNLSYSDYGSFASLLSLYTLATIPAQALTTIIVRFATAYFAKGEINKAATFYRKMIISWSLIGILITVGFAILSPFVGRFLKIEDYFLILIVGFIVAISYVGVVNTGFLQSLTRFPFMSFLNIVGASTRLIFGIILVILGYRVFGGIAAILIMAALTLLISFVPLRNLFRKGKTNISLNIKEVAHYAIPASLAVLFLSSFISTDVLLVKHYLSSTEAGLYGGMSLVGKVIFYFTGPIPVVMFPLLVKRHVKNERISSTFYLALALVALPSIAITAFYYLFPDFTINFFLAGREYLRVAPNLFLFGVFITIYSLLNVCVNFFLSLKDTKVFILVGIGALLQIILIYLRHSSFSEIIMNSIFSSSLLLATLLLYYIWNYKRKTSS